MDETGKYHLKKGSPGSEIKKTRVLLQRGIPVLGYLGIGGGAVSELHETTNGTTRRGKSCIVGGGGEGNRTNVV